MSLQYSGGTYVNSTFSPTTRADLVNNITSALATAGWTTISGTPGSGSDVKMETAAGNQGQKIRFRFFDPATGNCAQVTMKNIAESSTSSIGYILPSGTWRIIATKFHFFAFLTGGANATVHRSFIFGGTIYIPSFLTVPTPGNVGWMQAGGTTDIGTSVMIGFRRSLRQVSSSASMTVGMWGSNFLDTMTTQVASVSVLPWQGGTPTGVDNAYRWEDDTLPSYEALISWGTGSNTANESKIKGQLYDAMVVQSSWTGESLITVDGHSWLAITDAAAVNAAQLAALFVAVS